MHVLYIVATPIGNLEDISARALRVLGEVQLILAEDTRITRKLLARHKINTPLISYHEHNKTVKQSHILDALSRHDVALVSDAGTPGVCDPGSELVSSAASLGARVVSIPGPSAVAAAIASSGISGKSYVFAGFFPRRKTERHRLLSNLARETRTIVAFETPQRLTTVLKDILDILGDRVIAVCREMTKLHEEIFHGTISECIDHFSEPRGEFTLVITGADPDSINHKPDSDAITARIDQLRNNELSAKLATDALVAEFGLRRREAYRLWLNSKK